MYLGQGKHHRSVMRDERGSAGDIAEIEECSDCCGYADGLRARQQDAP